MGKDTLWTSRHRATGQESKASVLPWVNKDQGAQDTVLLLILEPNIFPVISQWRGTCRSLPPPLHTHILVHTQAHSHSLQGGGAPPEAGFPVPHTGPAQEETPRKARAPTKSLGSNGALGQRSEITSGPHLIHVWGPQQHAPAELAKVPRAEMLGETCSPSVLGAGSPDRGPCDGRQAGQSPAPGTELLPCISPGKKGEGLQLSR